MTGSGASHLQRTLLDSPDTVTHLLEALTGESIFADVVRQHPITAHAENELGVSAGHALTHRIAVLKGRTSDLQYLYAESMFLRERLPPRARDLLERTDDPIGHVLVAHGLRPEREVLPQPDHGGVFAPDILAGLSSGFVWSRAYRLIINGLPIFAVREWFLQPVLDALGRQTRA